MNVLCGVRFVGPLESHAPGFARELARLGFTRLSTRNQLGLAAHLSRWLAEQGLGLGSLDAAVVETFLRSRRVAGYRAYWTVKALAPLLDYLRGLGLVPQATQPTPATAVDQMLGRFAEYLRVERALVDRAVRGYVDLVRPFVVDVVADDGDRLASLNAGDVNVFLVAESRRLSPKTTQRLASALRSLLRWWFVEGEISQPLAESVAKVANRVAGRPRYLSTEQVEALLAACDREQVAGLRDAAMLSLLARMGLRAGEVAGLRLEDIDWRRATITVRGKPARCDLLPLPADVGQAIADYLRHGRPATALDRGVFLRVMAPHRSLTAAGVTQAVAAAARRAGLGTVHSHRLRHSAATSMLAGGASLGEIGQVLRHRRQHTTAIYAKVDMQALRRLARPWPVTP